MSESTLDIFEFANEINGPREDIIVVCVGRSHGQLAATLRMDVSHALLGTVWFDADGKVRNVTLVGTTPISVLRRIERATSVV